MDIPELDNYIGGKIQGVFGQGEMQILKREIEKLTSGDVYMEVGTDEGRSARVAHEYANKNVYKLWIDINDPTPRGKFMQDEGMVGTGKKGFWVHGDADEFSEFMFSIFSLHFVPFIDLIFIDGHHDYESVKKNTLRWEPWIKWGGVMLFHDYDHPETKKWLDEHFPGDRKEVFFNKIVKVIK